MENTQENSKNILGQRIAALRKEQGRSRADLGKELALHETTIKRYEDGDIKNVDIDKVKEFAKALNTIPEYLLGWSDNPNPTMAVLDDEDIREVARKSNLERNSNLQNTLRSVIKAVLAAEAETEVKNDKKGTPDD